MKKGDPSKLAYFITGAILVIIGTAFVLIIDIIWSGITLYKVRLFTTLFVFFLLLWFLLISLFSKS